MNNDEIGILNGFFQLPHLQKKKVVDAINDYLDSTDRDPIRAEYDLKFEELRNSDPDFDCKCCGRR